MRTTLNLDDDVLQAARLIAKQDESSVGAAMSALARRGLAHRSRSGGGSGIPVVDVPPGARLVGPEDIARALEEW